jgi:hypothetical protein
MRDFTNLVVSQKSRRLAFENHRATMGFPADEPFAEGKTLLTGLRQKLIAES